jgi:hypothetical protein
LFKQIAFLLKLKFRRVRVKRFAFGDKIGTIGTTFKKDGEENELTIALRDVLLRPNLIIIFNGFSQKWQLVSMPGSVRHWLATRFRQEAFHF